MTRTILAASVALALVFGTAAQAADEKAATETAASGDAFKNADRNGDDALDLEEMRNMMSRIFHQLDTNKDGKLSRGEHPDLAESADGITLEQYMGATADAFRKADKNGDGKLSRAEESGASQ